MSWGASFRGPAAPAHDRSPRERPGGGARTSKRGESNGSRLAGRLGAFTEQINTSHSAGHA